MADRTLRRAYNGVTEDARVNGNTDAGDKGREPKRGDGVEESDREFDADGNIGERDSGSNGGGIPVVEIDPSELDGYIAGNSGDSGDSGEPRKRRGRKPGSRNKSGAKKAQETVEPFLLMAHQWAAVFLKTPEIALGPEEAKQLSDAYSNFCEYHEIPILSPKRMSEVNMIAALLLVYGPRIIAVRNRIKEEARVKKAKNITPIAAVN